MCAGTALLCPISPPPSGVPSCVQESRVALKGGLKDKMCWFDGDFSAVWCGKVGVEVGCFIV